MRVDDEINLLFQQAVVANSNKKPSDKRKMLFFVFLLLSIFISIFSFGIPLYNKTKSLEKNLVLFEQITAFDAPISKEEKLVLKNLVKHLAEKEHKHYNRIHAELRGHFNYRSYHYLDQRTYIKVKNYLYTRLRK